MKYCIKKVIARNSHAEVLIGECYNEHQSYAVQIQTSLPPIYGKVLERLTAAKALEHPGICRLVDFGECCDKGVNKYYATSLYVPGITLTQLLQRIALHKIKPPKSLIYHIISSVCDVLEYTHQVQTGKSGFIPHGNICPDQVLISFDGNVLLTDTGIADLITYHYNGMGIIRNELSVFSHPDLFKRKDWKKRYELYSLGVLLLCLVNGYDEFILKLDQLRNTSGNSLLSAFPHMDIAISKIISSLIDEKYSGGAGAYTRIEELRDSLKEYRVTNSIEAEKHHTMLSVYSLYHNVFEIPQDITIEVDSILKCHNNFDESLRLLLQKTGFLNASNGKYNGVTIQDYKVETESISFADVEQVLKQDTDNLEFQYSNPRPADIQGHGRKKARIQDSVVLSEGESDPEFSCIQKVKNSSIEAFSGIRIDTASFYRTDKDQPFANLIIKR